MRMKMAHQRYRDMAEAFLKLYPVESDAQAGNSQNESARDRLRTSMYLWTYYWDHTLPGPDAERTALSIPRKCHT
jgi:hypothetical protein